MNAHDDGSSAFKSRDAHSYDGLVDDFDRFTERYTLPIAQRMVELIRLQARDQVLDVGAGTGVVALEVARHLDGGRVVAADLSQQMLDGTARRAEARGLTNVIETSKQDAEALTFDDGTFDRLVSLYALFHFPNPKRAIAEMNRVLRPGGIAAVAVGSGPPLRSRQGVAYITRRLPFIVNKRLGRWVAAPEFLDGLVDRMLPPPTETEEAILGRERHGGIAAGALPTMFEDAGFASITTHTCCGLGVIDSPETFWDLQRTFSSKARKRLEQANADDVGRLRETFLANAADVQRRGGKLTYPYAAFIVVARKR